MCNYYRDINDGKLRRYTSSLAALARSSHTMPTPACVCVLITLGTHQSAEYASFHERMKSIDWKTEDEEILRAVAEAVANLPPPTTTND